MIYSLLSSFYIVSLMFSPILHAVILKVGGWQMFAWTPMTAFLSGVIDVVNQNFGKAKARQTVVVALTIRALFYLGILPLLFFLPHVQDLGLTEMFHQTFRNFAVSEGITFVVRYWMIIPMFSKMKSPFWWKYLSTGALFTIIKSTVQTFLQYVGVPGVSLWSLIFTDMPTKFLFLAIGTPFAIGLNLLVKKFKNHGE